MQATQSEVGSEARARVIWILPEPLVERIKRQAKQEHRSVSGQATVLIEEALRAREVAA